MTTFPCLPKADLDIIYLIARFACLRPQDVFVWWQRKIRLKSIRAKLRRLAEIGYVLPVKFETEQGYILTPLAERYLERRNIEIPPKKLTALQISSFFLRLEIGVQKNEIITVERCIPYWQRQSHKPHGTDPSGYLLQDEWQDEQTGQTHRQWPHGLALLKASLKTQIVRRLFFIEFTTKYHAEALLEKVKSYASYHRQARFRKWGRIDDFRVLLISPSKKQQQRFQAHLAQLTFGELFWTTGLDQIRSPELVSEPIWQDHNGMMKAIVQTHKKACPSR